MSKLCIVCFYIPFFSSSLKILSTKSLSGIFQLFSQETLCHVNTFPTLGAMRVLFSCSKKLFLWNLKKTLIIILSTNKFLNKWNISSHLHVSYMMTIIARWLRSIIRAKWCDAYELLVEVPTIEWELIERTWEWLIVYNLNVMTSNACLRNLHYTRCYLDPSTWSRGY